jgi:hypothetical protein
MKIILSLIKSNDYNNIEKIIEELDLESINITEIIFEGLSKELDNEKNIYWREYMIKQLGDLNNEQIINFYYILLKYILKNSLYVYRIKFLDTNRRSLLNLLKQNFSEIEKFFKEEKNLYKVEYIINSLANSEYDLNSKNKNEGNQNYSSNICFKSIERQREEYDGGREFSEMTNQSQESKNTTSIYVSTEIFKNIADSILKKSRIIIDLDIDIDIDIDKTNIKFYHGDKLDQILDVDYLFINVDYEKYIKSLESDEESKITYINYQRFLQYCKEVIEYLKQSRIKFNPRITMELKRQNSNENTKSKNKEYHGIYNINCDYIFINQIKGNEELIFYDKNILINGINGNNVGFILLVKELSDEDYSEEKFLYNNNIVSNNNNESAIKT